MHDSDTHEKLVFCQFMGKAWANNYAFNISDMQVSLSRCNVIVYGQYYFVSSMVEPSVMEFDESNRKRVELNICVFIQYN